MTQQTPPSDDAAVTPSAPYVGLRPYNREEADWFHGRDADAQVLVDKVLSSRLTLLYAPSGVGKSSLLTAKVMPALEDEDCRVVYADGWSGSDPAGDVKDRLAAVAATSGVVDPMAGAPTLAELARLMTADGKTLVLVFDQFEEFLVNHAQGLDPLRKELAALVRMQAIDARVLISLREEFLAALEPFRAEILTLFQSTMRLEGLSDNDVLAAIQQPAARFGGSVDLDLAQRLLKDLSGSADAPVQAPAEGGRLPTWLDGLRRWWAPHRPTAPARTRDPTVPVATARGIDLPMMQLVCRSMWGQAPVNHGRRVLSLALYETELGGNDRILARHIQSCMPRRWSERLFTARLMRFLAPRSGMKISYSVTDLSELADFEPGDRPRMQAELVRLSDSHIRILHRREFRGDVRYELQHDALVQHIAPWRDAVLRDQRHLRWTLQAGTAFLLLSAAWGWTRFHDLRQEHKDTTQKLLGLPRAPTPEQAKRATQEFEYVVNHLLNQGTGPDRLDRLRSLLQENAAKLPEGYALPDRIESTVLLAPANAGLTLRYGAARQLDPAAFQQAWAEVARRLTSRWGVPVPARIALLADEGHTERWLRLEAQDKALFEIDDVETLADQVVVDNAGMTERVLEFAQRFESAWGTPTKLATSNWKAVPLWSLPVWRYGGLTARSNSAYPALLLESLFNVNPGLLATPEAAYALATRLSETGFPCTAAEAWTQRDLAKDIAAWVGGGTTGRPTRPLVNPHLLFELLTALPDQDSIQPLLDAPDTYAAAVETTRRVNWPVATAAAQDCKLPPWAGKRSSGGLSLVGLSTYMDARAWLTAPAPKLRVALGSELVKSWGQALAGSPVRERPAATPARTSERSGWDQDPVQSAAKGAPRPTTGEPTAAQPAASSLSVEQLPMLQGVFEEHRRTVYERTGVWLPDFRAQNASDWMAGTDASSLRLATFDSKDAGARPIGVDRAARSAARSIRAAFEAGIAPASRGWVDAEYVGQLMQKESPLFDPRLADLQQKWLRVAISDLTMLLREVVGGEASGDEAAEVASIRDPGWLVSSLVFWKAYYTNDGGNTVAEHKDVVKSLARYMRRLQARRLQSPSGQAVHRPASPLLEAGLASLAAGRFDEASKRFEQAVAAGPYREVADQFIDRYAQDWTRDVRARARSTCKDPTDGDMAEPKLQLELEAALVRGTPGAAIQETRDLWQCLLASSKNRDQRTRERLMTQAAQAGGDPASWPVKQARWLAQTLLTGYEPIAGSPELLEQGRRFLFAVIRRASRQVADSAFVDVALTCQSPGPKAWCWALLKQAAQQRPDPWIALDHGMKLLDRETDQEEALAAFHRAESLAVAPAVPAASKARFDVYLKISRALIQSLRAPGSHPVRDTGLETSEPVKAAKDLAKWLLLVLQDEVKRSEPFDLGEARRLIDRRKELAGSGPASRAEELNDSIFMALRGGDLMWLGLSIDAAVKLLEDRSLEGVVRTAMLFSVASAGLITGDPRAGAAASQFLETDHLYVPVIAVLQRWRANAGERQAAEQRLLERWGRIDRESWPARLNAGDPAVWYEKLLGYPLDKVSESEIFAPLADDASFARSPLSGLGFSRLAMLTEANFYDALKRSQKGDLAGAHASLERVLKAGRRGYIEYAMAHELLRANPKWPASPATAQTR